MRIFKLSQNGTTLEYIIDEKIIQEFINKKRESLGDSYNSLEMVSLNSFSNDSVYRTYFTRSTIKLPIEELFVSQEIGVIPNYEYYEDIYFDDLFQIFNVIKIRISMDWKFRYIISDFSERMHPIVANKLKNLMANKQ